MQKEISYFTAKFIELIKVNISTNSTPTATDTSNSVLPVLGAHACQEINTFVTHQSLYKFISEQFFPQFIFVEISGFRHVSNLNPSLSKTKLYIY